MTLHDPDALSAALQGAFAWVEFLPPQDRQLFAEELTQLLLASASVGIYSSVAQLIREWKTTAEIHTDPELTRRLQCPLEAAGDAVVIPVN